ncbi:acyltransferase family protein [uncultured Legionella sp.]|uniref:acyltransferase family protein n=1 Tax=uncultured Legionella sp. TaxID=210934 RepID=UPI002613C082|nr:acyltransferase family protein [uncultured Legionella sp.]
MLVDLIRFALAFIVVIGHGFGFFWGYFDGFFPRVFPHPQSIAVIGFFYLSGYLIVGSVLKQKSRYSNAGLGNYLFNRVLRIYLTLIPSIVFVIIVDFLFKNYTTLNLDLVTNNTNNTVLIKNIFLIPSMPYGTMRPIWSLMYEWWIYIFFGGIFFFKKNIILASLFILAGFYYTVFLNAQGEAGHIWIIWAVGGLCAYLQKYSIWNRVNPNIHHFLILFFLMTSAVGYFYTKDAVNLISGILFALFLYVLCNYRGALLKYLMKIKNPIKKLAGLSFTLFLTHYTVLTYIKEYFELQGIKGLIFGTVLSIYIAYFIACFTEYRLVRIKEKVFSKLLIITTLIQVHYSK